VLIVLKEKDALSALTHMSIQVRITPLVGLATTTWPIASNAQTAHLVKSAKMAILRYLVHALILHGDKIATRLRFRINQILLRY